MNATMYQSKLNLVKKKPTGVDKVSGFIDWAHATFSPRIELFKMEYFEIWEKYLKKKGWAYGIAYEEGKNKVHPHIHILANRKSKNFGRDLLTEIKLVIESKTERAITMKAKAHNDPKYCFGYLKKEGNRFSSSESSEYIDSSTEYYEKRVLATRGNKKEWECISVNRIYDYCSHWLIGQKTHYEVDGFYEGSKVETTVKMKAILLILHKEGKIPTTLFLKYRPLWEDAWNVILEDMDIEAANAMCARQASAFG